MIKKLRAKLVAASMLSLFLVLTVIMGAVNFLNYREILAEADETLSILQENGGVFPKREDLFRPEDGVGPEPESQADQGEKVRQKPFSPELPYESRYFSVRLTQSGAIVSVDTGKIAAVDTDTAAEFAQAVFATGSERGFLGDYRYARSAEGEESLIIFLDCGRGLSTFRTFLAASCGISFLGLLAVFGLILLFSKRIIRPILESYEKQKRFITDAGHEIRTPITIIDADAEILEMEEGENEWLRDIKAQTKRLTALTNDLVFLSRMEEEKPRLAEIELPFSDLVSETAQSFQAPAKTQGKHLSLQIQPMLTVKGDEKALRQLVSILLENALKYSVEESGILLSLEERKRNICLAVENTTEAALPEQLNAMFERFYRADPSRSSQTGGYGLGLSIAKAVVEAHRGKIKACLAETSQETAGKESLHRLRIEAIFPACAHTHAPSQRPE